MNRKTTYLIMTLLAFMTLAFISNSTYAFQDDAPDTTEEVADADDSAAPSADADDAADADDEDEADAAPAEPVDKIEYDAAFMVNNLWIMIAGMLVFIMHLGFATLESGLTRSKNTVNILFKNTMIVCIGLITYGICGFNLMYPGFDTVPDDWDKDTQGEYEFKDDGYFKFAGFGFMTNGPEIASMDMEADPAPTPEEVKAFNDNTTSEYADYTLFTDFFFQAMFAATCCTIVSGAVAGRVKLGTFLIFCLLFVSISYPITGSWKWGYGFLHRLGFYDFAGSTLVHSVGGWGALVMAGLLGARHGKYVDGRPQALAPSSLPLAAIGVFLLWFGWFGFNGGSVLSADPGLVSLVLVTTSMAAAAGGLAAALISTIHGRKPDLSMALNGILAGLVGITAGADLMDPIEAIIIGAIAGVLVYFAVIFIDSVVKIDDPVGAISVHLICGIWGTLAVGIFGTEAGQDQLIAQLIGIGAIGAFTVVFCLILGLLLKFTLGLRVSPEEEMEGLDIGEHGMSAYSFNG